MSGCTVENEAYTDLHPPVTVVRQRQACKLGRRGLFWLPGAVKVEVNSVRGGLFGELGRAMLSSHITTNYYMMEVCDII